MLKSEVIAKVRAYYEEQGSLAQELFDRLAERQRRPRGGFTSVDQIRGWFPDFTRQEIVAFLRQLAQLGAGRFVVGRWEWPSRLEWEGNAIRLAKVVTGEAEPDEIGEDEYPEEEEEDPVGGLQEGELPAVQLRIRPGLVVRVEGIPPDFTTSEAKRLAAVICALPCED